MDKVKTGLRGLNALDKLSRGRIVLQHMSGNPHFVNPEPSMAELQAACDELSEACQKAEDRGRIAILRKQMAVDRMDQYLTRLAGYANSTALGESSKLMSSGFELVKSPQPRNTIEAPVKFGSMRTFMPGEIKLRWKCVPGALIYELETVISEERGWERLLMTSNPRVTLNELVPNSWHVFRVRAIGTKATGPYGQTLYTRSAA